MADFIERGDAFDAVMGQFCACSDETEAALNGAIEDIRKIPAADVRPVVHAWWIDKHYDDWDGHIYADCTNCHHSVIINDFCGKCGAMMDGEG